MLCRFSSITIGDRQSAGYSISRRKSQLTRQQSCFVVLLSILSPELTILSELCTSQLVNSGTILTFFQKIHEGGSYHHHLQGYDSFLVPFSASCPKQFAQRPSLISFSILSAFGHLFISMVSSQSKLSYCSPQSLRMIIEITSSRNQLASLMQYFTK